MIINRGFVIPAREFKIFVPESGDTVYVGVPFTMEVSTVGLEDTTTVYMERFPSWEDNPHVQVYPDPETGATVVQVERDPFDKILGQFRSTGGDGSGYVTINWDFVDVACAEIIENGQAIEIVGHNQRTLKVTDGIRVLTLDLDVIGNKDFNMGTAEADLKWLPDLTDDTAMDIGTATVAVQAQVIDREHSQKLDYGTAAAAITYEIKDHRMIFADAKCFVKYLPDETDVCDADAGTAECDIHAAVEDRERSQLLTCGMANAALSDMKTCLVGCGTATAAVLIHQ